MTPTHAPASAADWTPLAIRTLRDRLGLAQEDFAVLVGTRVTTVCRWENGHSSPSRVFRLRLAVLAREGAA